MPSRTRYLNFLQVLEEKNIPHAASRTFLLALRIRLRRFGRVCELEPNQRDPQIPRARKARLRLGKFKGWLEKVGCRLNIPGH